MNSLEYRPKFSIIISLTLYLTQLIANTRTIIITAEYITISSSLLLLSISLFLSLSLTLSLTLNNSVLNIIRVYGLYSGLHCHPCIVSALKHTHAYLYRCTHVTPLPASMSRGQYASISIKAITCICALTPYTMCLYTRTRRFYVCLCAFRRAPTIPAF